MPKNISTKNTEIIKSTKPVTAEMVEITESTMRDKIHIIRGRQVMLDSDLSNFYGYETKYLNRQVQRNKEKFEGEDFMFRLTKEETDEILKSSRCQKVTLKNAQGHNIKWRPYAFTEQGIYMLMTVLKGETAVRQSRILVMLFKQMKDFIFENQANLTYHENLRLASQVTDNTKDIEKIKNEMEKMDARMVGVTNDISNLVKRSEISPILLDFTKDTEMKEFLIMNGELTRAKETFLDIYAKAKKTIYIIDNYINLKTLHLLQSAKSNIEIIIFTDNNNKYLRKSDYQDFITERPDLKLKFVKTNNQIHDRFIILDNETIYHCGISSKDAGNKITIIQEVTTDIIKKGVKDIIKNLSENEELRLN